MNKWILCLCCFLPFFSWSETPSVQNELETVEEEIQALKESLSQERLVETNEEVKGQEEMIADWDAYAQTLERVRKQEEKDRQIQAQIQQLENRKAQLIQQQAQSK